MLMAPYNERNEGPSPLEKDFVDPNTEPSLAGFERYADTPNHEVRLPSYPAWGNEFMKNFESMRTSPSRTEFERYTADQPYAENARLFLGAIDNIAHALNRLREGSYAEQPLEEASPGPISLEARLIEKRHQAALADLQRNMQQALTLQACFRQALRDDVSWASTGVGEEWKDPAKLPFQFLSSLTDNMELMKTVLLDAAHRR
jgi:hypothetical protein